MSASAHQLPRPGLALPVPVAPAVVVVGAFMRPVSRVVARALTASLAWLVVAVGVFTLAVTGSLSPAKAGAANRAPRASASRVRLIGCMHGSPWNERGTASCGLWQIARQAMYPH